MSILGLIECPKLGGPDILAAHKGKKAGPPGPIVSAAYMPAPNPQ